MKKMLIVCLFLVPLFSQNLQVHYELLPERQYITSTLEQFTGDKGGLTYWFVSASYDHAPQSDFLQSSAMSVYGEFYRFFSIPAFKGIMPGIQYNDGLAVAYDDQGGSYGFPFGRTLLAGLGYNVKLFGVDVLTTIWWRKKQGFQHDWQFTAAWGQWFADGKLTFNGFFDLWGEKALGSNDAYRLVLLAEPQLYYNFTENISAGIKTQISHHFDQQHPDGIYIAPTVALRWNF